MKAKLAPQKSQLNLKMTLLTLAGYFYVILVGVVVTIMASAVGFLIDHYVLDLSLVVLFPIVLLALIIYFVFYSGEKRQPNGVQLSKVDAPELFAVIQEVRTQLEARNIHQVVLSSNYEVRIQYSRLLGMIGTRSRTLYIGVPVLLTQSVDGFKSLLAQEMAHIAAVHGKLRNLVYEVHQIYVEFNEQLELKSGFFSSLFAGFFHRYVPIFLRETLEYQRKDDVLADQLAVLVTDRQTTASAIISAEVYDHMMDNEFDSALFENARDQAEPPHDFLERFRDYIAHSVTVEDYNRVSNKILVDVSATGTQNESSIRERLVAMNAEIPVGKPSIDISAVQLLGSRQNQIMRQVNNRWQDEIEVFWRDLHAQYAERKQRYEELKNKDRTDEEAWEYILCVEVVDGVDTALPLMLQYLESNREDVSANFSVGRILLERDDEAGIEYLRKAIQYQNTAIDYELLFEAYSRIIDFYTERHDEIQAISYREKLAAFERKYRDLMNGDTGIAKDETFAEPRLSDEVIYALSLQLRQIDAIEAAYLVRRNVRHSNEATHLLGIRHEGRFDEIEEQLDSLPAEVILLSLEGELSWLRRPMTKVQSAQIYKP